ncbi:hypothetical protein V1478_015270 [Vespula squamosa]|uniref:C2H2-type domain-containing protein n=1 Tax=Vespula squamosa TaxID=30214 RepID=A0ABD2A4Z8_VESSQ
MQVYARVCAPGEIRDSGVASMINAKPKALSTDNCVTVKKNLNQATALEKIAPSARDLAEAGPSEVTNKCMHKCSFCGYVSSRKFNVLRHTKRIHEPMKNPRTCCGITHNSKSDYYLHCELVHPNRRSRTKISKYKYHIITGVKDSFGLLVQTVKPCRRSERIRNYVPKDSLHVTCKTSLSNCTNITADSTDQCSEKTSNVISEENQITNNSYLHSNESQIYIDFSGISDLDHFTNLHRRYLQNIDFDNILRLEE